uniref:RNA-dependent RNA polymerase n=1 Tax=Grapevine-associated RNA virus 6 TaxID=2814392 RepID=A0A8F5ML09_9VIRU|nr:MAG: RNA-dependent RNA polymerase [Grapevine-associated RNA virus 6]
MPRTAHYMRPQRRMGQSAGVAAIPIQANTSREDGSLDYEVNDLAGALTVTTERTWHIEVPHQLDDDAERRFKLAPNPHNQCGPLLSAQVPVVTASDWGSLMAAFDKRCNTVHKDDVGDAEYETMCRLIDAIQFEEDPWHDNDVDRELWLAKFDVAKAGRMRKASLAFADAEAGTLGDKTLSVKLEALLKRCDPVFAARVIYSGSDAFNAVTGPAALEVMRRMELIFASQPLGPIHYRTAYKKNDVTMACHLADEIDDCPFVVEGDYSANDKHQRNRVHKLFNRFLKKIRMPDWLPWLLTKMNTFRVVNYKFGIKATLSDQLPTGTTFTTPRNTLWNALQFSVACLEQEVQLGYANVLGDDLLACLQQELDLPRWIACVDRCRMVLKAKAPALNGEATFLSKRLILNTPTPCMVPLLGKALARFNARAVYDGAKTHSQYMAGKALSYMYEFRHVPFLRDYFYTRFEREDKSRLSLEDLTWGAKTSGIDIENVLDFVKNEKVLVSDDNFLDWVMDVYDIGLVDVDELFSLIILDDKPIMVDHPAVDRIAIDW